ncbi:hypothetical protein SAMN02745166_02266 [Prosthecobacter debontii]|uniref:Uncharacterized protein n=1 Tax=Prosthecobacter debontii TaxID=48467 RepID=A0A1T4Y0C5_9BACT|nr:hypothetical protein [Prosthecobacter debontii]SKA95083.1 hypothetical protein SAMN02745166_02266 [Prosthecobacter debontii]
MPPTIAYISQGKLFMKPAVGGEVEIVSDFVRSLKQRLKSVEDRQAFRGSGSGAAFMRGGVGSGGATVEDTFFAEFSAVASGVGPNQVCYAIDAGDVRGLFVYDLAEKYERRVLHGPRHRFAALDVRQEEGTQVWLVAAAQDHGDSRIGLFRPDVGGGVQELTEGDSLDSYPCWLPEGQRGFVYQTSGIARQAHGPEWAGLGPASLQRIHLDTGSLETVAEDDRYDFLCPAYGRDGSLYYLKRPYVPFHRVPLWQQGLDVLLFPFRLLRAVVAFLNVFSVFFSGKPLQTAGQGPRREGPDPKAVFLHGRWVRMEKQMRDAAVDEMTSAVPKNWELIRQTPEGLTTSVLTGVMAFTVASDGSLIYSNGRGVWAVDGQGGKPVKLSSRSLVTALCVVEGDSPPAAAHT